MLRGIVVQPPQRTSANLSLNQASATVAASGMVTPSQLQVARLSYRRFLVLLPPTLDRDKVASAIPKDLWDQGFTFHSYSPLTDTSISIPFFKLWIDIKRVPLELQNEAHIARAVSSFGLYLGSMEPNTPGDCHSWSVFLATDDLALVPHQLEFKVGGMAYNATIHPRKWIKGQVYCRDDLPPAPKPFHPPASPPTPSKQTLPDGPPSWPSWFEEDDVVPMSLTALREIFRDVDPSSLPSDLAKCLAGDKNAIATNHATGREWEYRREQERILAHFTHDSNSFATPDPTSFPLPHPDPFPPMESQGATEPALPRFTVLRPLPQVTPLLSATDNTRRTGHRTDLHAPPCRSSLQDPAPQLCADRSAFVRAENRSSWDP